MILDRVTITGADDSIRFDALEKLSLEFPFVEWGILASRSNGAGAPRFPSPRWFTDLQGMAEMTGDLKLSLHLCGRWVRDLLVGKVTFPESHLHCFQRVQLNFHAEGSECDPDAFNAALQTLGQRQFIFQIDGSNGNEHMESVSDAADCANQKLDAVALFDVSGGAGIVPREWPKPQYIHCVPGPEGNGVEVFEYHGYAGGLGPDNLEYEIGRIAEAAGDCRIWIDMETKVRSPDDQQFDLAKVRRCLEIVQPHVQQDAAF